ncbi:MAG: bile acid:sodium symporter family protein [Thermoguttaceae bacterium]|nr:bile acid:sodium symporter family protein [Thermoguttaceae bacterium]
MFKRILSKYLLIWLTFVCVLAFYWPALFGENAFNPFFIKDPEARKNLMSGMIAATMLAVGSLLPYDEVKAVAKRWHKTIMGTAIQYISMPLLAFCVAKALRLEGAAFTGVMMAGCVPGAMASNVLTLTARGNVSYSVGLTTTATLLSPIVVPLSLLLFLHQKDVDLDVAGIMINLLETVVAPVVIGFVLSRVSKFWKKNSDRFAEIVANLVIIWIISSVVAQNANNVAKLTPALIGAMLLLNFGGYLAGYFGGKAVGLDSGMRRALTIEVGMQNAGLGTVLATRFFPDQPEAALFCASYTFGCMFTGIILAQAFKTAAERKEKSEESKEVEAN